MTTHATLASITKLIVQNALDEKPCRGLLLAYSEECEHLCDTEGYNKAEFMPVVEGEECERVMRDEFVRAYQLELDHQVSTETCLEVFMYPHGFDTHEIPRKVLLVVARTMARRDARMANALRRGRLAMA